jgi:hypothetical protein
MDNDSIREDLGYMRYEQSTRGKYLSDIGKVRIEYIAGMLKGTVVTIRKDFAEDLIERGFAKYI